MKIFTVILMIFSMNSLSCDEGLLIYSSDQILNKYECQVVENALNVNTSSKGCFAKAATAQGRTYFLFSLDYSKKGQSRKFEVYKWEDRANSYESKIFTNDYSIKLINRGTVGLSRGHWTNLFYFNKSTKSAKAQRMVRLPEKGYDLVDLSLACRAM